MKKTVSVDELVRGVRCETRSKMEIDAQFIGHILVEVCRPDGHAAAPDLAYRIEGPGGSFAGTTDGDGRLRHEDVIAGDYLLTFPGLDELKRLVPTSARKDRWQRTLALTPPQTR